MTEQEVENIQADIEQASAKLKAETKSTKSAKSAKPLGKTLNNTDIKGARKQVSDIETFGDDDAFKLILKASSKSEGWMKSTKAMSVGKGCIVQVTTQQRNPDGSYAVAEAVTYVPGVSIREIEDNGTVVSRSLVGVR